MDNIFCNFKESVVVGGGICGRMAHGRGGGGAHGFWFDFGTSCCAVLSVSGASVRTAPINKVPQLATSEQPVAVAERQFSKTNCFVPVDCSSLPEFPLHISFF